MGEIYIKTPFRTKGYYKDEVQTKERFIQNPLHKDYEDIIYKTGDLGRYLEDRRIEFVGRQDSQVKIRGNRVEISEIEKVFYQYPGIEQVVVLPIKKAEGEDVLACYYTESAVTEEDNLRNFIKDYLPDYMFPSYYVKMETFPLNLNGKIDKRSLPRPEEMLYEKLKYEAPKEDLEKSLAAIWSEVLGLKKVGIKNSFFELGGHSLTATRVVSKIYKELGREISLKDFFDHSTVRSLAEFLKQKEEIEYKQIEALEEREYYELSNAQKRLWVLDQMHGSIPYHMPGACYINTELDRLAFEKAFKALILRHETLRTTFIEVHGEPKQKILKAEELNFKINYSDLRLALSFEEDLESLVKFDITTPFNLRKDPLIRARLIQKADGQYLFLFNIHHIVSDGWSRAVFLKDIIALYEAFKNGKETPLEPLRIQYKDFAAWQNNAYEGKMKKHEIYWKEKLSGNTPALNLAIDFERPLKKNYSGKKHLFQLSKPLSNDLREICQFNEVSLYMLILSVLNIELYKLTDEKDIIIGSPVAGRNHPDLENQIGFYLNNIALRNKIDRKASFKEFLIKVKQVTLEAFEHQDYPFDKIVEELKIQPSGNRNPIYDVLLVMNNSELNGSKKDLNKLYEIFAITGKELKDNTSKLDLSLFVNDTDEISMVVEYSTELLKMETVQKIEKDLVRIMELVTENEFITISDIIWNLSGFDKEQLLGNTIDIINENF
jgi:mycobactin peptide synthetase MbtE